MARLLYSRRMKRQSAHRAYRFWSSWFILTVVGLLVLSSVSRNNRDLGTHSLLETLVSVNRNDQNKNNENRNLSRETKGDLVPEEVYFLDHTQLAWKDGFSATWLQRREDFLTMPFDEIASCEQAAFKAFDHDRYPMLRMTLDWMQFSVEHLSRWWKILEWDQFDAKYKGAVVAKRSQLNNASAETNSFTNIPAAALAEFNVTREQSIPWETILRKFQSYLQSASDVQPQAVLQNTIAVLAFQAYRSTAEPEAARMLTIYSLAATVESLRRAGFGRCVVALLVPEDLSLIQAAYRVLADQLGQNSWPGKEVAKIGHMEVGYAYASHAFIKTSLIRKNMPRATIMTLRDAFLHAAAEPADRTEEMNSNITAWLGDTQKQWDYVYLSEPDTILQLRSAALPALKEEIDKGNLLIPHRWQPIPHESDVRGLERSLGTFLLEEEFGEVLELDPNSNHDACCDEKRGKNVKPGLPPYHSFCGKHKFWYQCGFLEANRKDPNKHARLRDYKLMRLVGGMEIATISGNEHARRCTPKRHSVCRPDDFYPEYIGPNPGKKWGPRETAPPYSEQ